MYVWRNNKTFSFLLFYDDVGLSGLMFHTIYRIDSSFSRNVFDMNSWWWPLKNVKHNKNIEFEGKKGPFVGPYFVFENLEK